MKTKSVITFVSVACLLQTPACHPKGDSLGVASSKTQSTSLARDATLGPLADTSSTPTNETGGAATPEELRTQARAALAAGDWSKLGRLVVIDERGALASVALVLAVTEVSTVIESLESLVRANAGGGASDVAGSDSGIPRLRGGLARLDALVAQTGTTLDRIAALSKAGDNAALSDLFPDPDATLFVVNSVLSADSQPRPIEWVHLDPQAPLHETEPHVVSAPIEGGGHVLMTERNGRWYLRVLGGQPSRPRPARLDAARLLLREQAKEDLAKLVNAAVGTWSSPWGSLSFDDPAHTSVVFPWHVRPGAAGKPEFVPDHHPQRHAGALDMSHPYQLGLRNGSLTTLVGAYVDEQGALHVGQGIATPITPDRVAFLEVAHQYELQVTDTCRLVHKFGRVAPTEVTCRFTSEWPTRFEYDLPAEILGAGKSHQRLVYLESEQLLVPESLWLSVFRPVEL